MKSYKKTMLTVLIATTGQAAVAATVLPVGDLVSWKVETDSGVKFLVADGDSVTAEDRESGAYWVMVPAFAGDVNNDGKLSGLDGYALQSSDDSSLYLSHNGAGNGLSLVNISSNANSNTKKSATFFIKPLSGTNAKDNKLVFESVNLNGYSIAATDFGLILEQPLTGELIEQSTFNSLTSTVRFNSHNFNGYYIKNTSGSNIQIRNAGDGDTTALWKVVPALNGNSSHVSFQSTQKGKENSYLRHRNAIVHLDRYQNSKLYKADGSWIIDTGLATSKGVSIKATNYPNYMRHQGHTIKAHKITSRSRSLDKNDATFYIEHQPFKVDSSGTTAPPTSPVKPPVTQPPVEEPPKPPVTQPPVEEPPKPPVTQPPVEEPPKPPVTQPPVEEPKAKTEYRFVEGNEIPFFDGTKSNFIETYNARNRNLWHILDANSNNPVIFTKASDGRGNWRDRQSGFVSKSKHFNYQLEFEFKYDVGRGTDHNNSGVWILGGDDIDAIDGAYPRSLEIQLRQDARGNPRNKDDRFWTGDILKKGLNADADGSRTTYDGNANGGRGKRIMRHPQNSMFDYNNWTLMVIKVVDASDYVDSRGRSKGTIVEVWAGKDRNNLTLVNKAQRVARKGPSRIAFQSESSNIRFRSIVLKELSVVDK